MLETNHVNRLANVLTAALVDKHIYDRRLAHARWKSRAVDFLALGTPVLYFALRLTAKGTPSQHAVEIGWEFLATLLIVLSLFKLIFQWDDYAAKYLRQLDANTRLANRTRNLIDRAASISRKEYEIFVDEAGQIEKEDRDVLGVVSKREEQRAYREALKEMDPAGEARCPECGTSARATFRKGDCPACGSLSIKKQAKEDAYATS